MPGIEIPRTWDDVKSFAKRIKAKPAYFNTIVALSQNPDTLYRVCMWDNPAFLPGALQDPLYAQRVIEETSRPRPPKKDLDSAILRAGMWRTFFSQGGRLEASIHADALTRRPSGMGKAALRTSLEHAYHLASHTNVDVLVRKEVGEEGGDTVGQGGIWTISYPKGPDAPAARATTTNIGVELALPLDVDEAVPELEKVWGIIQKTSYDREESLNLMSTAITMLPQDSVPPSSS
jgi:hypothetical protein